MSAHFYISNKILRGVTNSVITPNFYDSNGIRISKTVNDTTHTYFTEGSRIRAEKRVYAPASGEAAASNTPSDSTSLSRASGLFSQENSGASLNNSAQIPGVLPPSDVLTYIYDASGITGMHVSPSGTLSSSTAYFFLKNQQGDVKFIVDANGNTLNEYVYDAWGNHKIYKYLNGTILTDSSESPIDISHNPDYTNDIGNLNPFRYRGYYLDAETGWYYLNSRYYDPQTRRFLNADDPSVPLNDQATIFGGLNLYSYCLNNPVMYVDPVGCFPILIALILGAGLIIGGAVGGKVTYDNAVNAGKTGSELFWETIGGIVLGGTIGIAGAGLLMAGTAGVYAGVMIAIKNAALASLTIFGMAVKKVVAIGLLAYNIFASVVAPLVGLTLEMIGWVEDTDKVNVPKPGIAPKHPAAQISTQWILPFIRSTAQYYKY